MENRLPDARRRLMVERMMEMRRFDEAVMDLEEKYGSFGRAVTSIGNEAPVTALSLLTRPVSEDDSTALCGVLEQAAAKSRRVE